MATRSQSTMFASLLIVWVPVISLYSAAGIQDSAVVASSTLLPTTPAGETMFLLS